jgi:hypothetical protein
VWTTQLRNQFLTNRADGVAKPISSASHLRAWLNLRPQLPQGWGLLFALPFRWISAGLGVCLPEIQGMRGWLAIPPFVKDARKTDSR